MPNFYSSSRPSPSTLFPKVIRMLTEKGLTLLRYLKWMNPPPRFPEAELQMFLKSFSTEKLETPFRMNYLNTNSTRQQRAFQEIYRRLKVPQIKLLPPSAPPPNTFAAGRTFVPFILWRIGTQPLDCIFSHYSFCYRPTRQNMCNTQGRTQIKEVSGSILTCLPSCFSSIIPFQLQTVWVFKYFRLVLHIFKNNLISGLNFVQSV